MELPLSIEIPWILAASTQRLQTDGPEPTTISLSYFQPKVDSLALDYPQEYLVYLKFTVSISPFNAPWEKRITDLLTGGLPVWSLLFDLTVSPNPLQLGGIRPFFLAAAPLRRAMIERGVVGAELFEGESNGIAVGKSAAQLHETGSSHADTSTSGVGGSISWPMGSLGFNTQDTSTSATFDRTVTQQIDTTHREAAEERRELLSHRTNVENVLSLLEAKHVCSPYLRFMLRPRPLRPLTIDPGDPNLWYSQLLARRSSGIEGIQEFFAVIAVPHATNFCISADMTRIFALDVTPQEPGPEKYGFPAIDGPSAVARMERYLRTVYPPGTPLEELDIDILPAADAPNFPRPVVVHWNVSPHRPTVIAIVESPRPAPDWSNRNLNVYAYKHRYEVWRDTVRWEYERALTTSPLDLGAIFGVHEQLNTCFVRDASGALRVQNFLLRATPASDAGIRRTTDAGTAVRPRGTTSRRDQVRHVVDWNAAERRVAMALRTRTLESLRDQPFKGAHAVDFVVRQWAALDAADDRNEVLETAAPALGISASLVQKLRKSGIGDLRGLAGALDDAAAVDGLNRRQEQMAGTLDRVDKCALEPKPFEAVLAAADARSIRDAIAARLLVPAASPPRRRK